MMEADSMHSVIEWKLRNRKINVPADYMTICQNAYKLKPYTIKYLSFDFFKDLKKKKKSFCNDNLAWKES